jgi:hypothetical protein
MKIIKENNQIVYAISGLADNDKQVVQMGILKPDLAKYAHRGLFSSLGQFIGIVAPGLIIAKHLFVGLKRCLYDDGRMDGDHGKRIYCWKPAHDYEWRGDGFYGGIEQLKPPNKAVFVVIISKNEGQHKINYPSIYGWIDRWNWVDSDSMKDDVPINYKTRYGKQIY